MTLDVTWLNLNWIWIEIQFSNWIKIWFNSTEEKWDANCWRRHWKFAYEYGKNLFLKRMQIRKDTFSCLTWEWAKHILTWNCLGDNLWITKLKVILPKPIHMNHHHWNNPHATRGKVLETKEPLHISTGFWFEKINSIRNLKT